MEPDIKNKINELHELILQTSKIDSKNSKLNNMLLQMKEKMDDLNEKFNSCSSIDGAVAQVKTDMNEEGKRLASHGLNATFVNNSKSNLILLTIENVKSFLQNVKTGATTYVQNFFNNVFYSSFYGYRFTCGIDFYTDKIDIYLKLTTGKYDPLLRWPFDYNIEVVLLNQVDEANSKIVSLKPDPTTNGWQRPMNYTTLSGFLTWDSITLAEIMGANDDVSEFLRNDKLYFIVKVLQNDDTSCTIRCNLDTEFDSANLLREFKTHNFNELSVAQARSNMFIYTVEGISAILSSLNNGTASVNNQSSPQFYSSHVGYLMQCMLTVDREYLKVRAIIMQGQNDEMLCWPFLKRIRFVLINHIERCNDKVAIVNTKPAPKPINASQQVYVYCKDRDACDINLIRTAELCQYDGISDFLRNDRIYIQMKTIDE